MREILFRGKRIDNGEIVYGDLIHRKQLKNEVLVIRCNDFGFDNFSEYEVDPSTVAAGSAIFKKLKDSYWINLDTKELVEGKDE